MNIVTVLINLTQKNLRGNWSKVTKLTKGLSSILKNWNQINTRFRKVDFNYLMKVLRKIKRKVLSIDIHIKKFEFFAIWCGLYGYFLLKLSNFSLN